MTNRVKAAMSEQGEKPHFIDIDHTKSDEAWMIQKALRRWLGYWITPQVFVNGMHYGGAELLLDNHKTGLLADHLKEMKTEL
ncbi:glutaredoxin-C4 [Selaginella moellendorffii]|uniref:glutaredoxin-C4 n=1 Tax=Selaginella moellendorffii TaxID=88036 RepID=UPI000D1C8AAF|nr:glutaredoxin-C4 [Selaginella moellendorffii]XP_024543104.1 glutaredoxin-C4 [Selaginella moellendorffii]|eukprot:XP_024527190.1 glutaredoxin-C4 [Selaginella moellendorffii]